MTVTAGIEFGGTKVMVGFGTGPADLHDCVRIETTSPSKTLASVAKVLDRKASQEGLNAIGVAAFGPICLDADSPDWGRLLGTPKAGWADVNVLTRLLAVHDVHVALETDVTAAAVAEGLWGSAVGLTDFAYVTVGTGIGVGIIVNEAPVRGVLHPEGGHITVHRDRVADAFAGVCPYHGDCVEGLTSGPALLARTGSRPEHLDEGDPVWNLVGDYIAQLMANLTLMLSPQRIILGGGVGAAPPVVPIVRAALLRRLNGYLPALADPSAMAAFVVSPGLKGRSGVLGAIALANSSARVAHAAARTGPVSLR